MHRRAGDIPARQPDAVGDVGVIDARSVGLDERARYGRRRSARPDGRTDLRTFVACVSFVLEAVAGFNGDRVDDPSLVVNGDQYR